MENPIKMAYLGVPLFLETSKCLKNTWHKTHHHRVQPGKLTSKINQWKRNIIVQTSTFGFDATPLRFTVVVSGCKFPGYTLTNSLICKVYFTGELKANRNWCCLFLPCKNTLVDHGGFPSFEFCQASSTKTLMFEEDSDPNIMVGCWWSYPPGLKNMSHKKHHTHKTPSCGLFYVHITKSARNLGSHLIQKNKATVSKTNKMAPEKWWQSAFLFGQFGLFSAAVGVQLPTKWDDRPSIGLPTYRFRILSNCLYVICRFITLVRGHITHL